MKSPSILLLIATAAAAVACVEGDFQPTTDRLDLLARAFEMRRTDPDRAAELFSESGSGSFLERARLEAWFAALEDGTGDVDSWRDFLTADLPGDLEVEATLELARALLDRERSTEAVDVLEQAPASVRSRADEMLLALGEGAWQRPAATRLAVGAPHRLRRVAAELEKEVLPFLSPGERLDRAEQWLREGAPRTAASELRILKLSGESETERRVMLARAWLAAGSPTRALASLPSAARAGVDELVLRGEAFRTRAWQRVPTSRARASFKDCLDTAELLVTVADWGDAARAEGLRMVVECGTEYGALDRAVEAWFELEVVDRTFPRREWLGRRLGVAVAQKAGASKALDDLASALPTHSRCLRFWSASAEPNDGTALQALATAPIADIYGVWARQRLDLEGPSSIDLAAEMPVGPPPPSVRWLLEHDAAAEASREWRRIHSARGSSPGEALAAAALARELGRNNETIRWLRRGFPDLGGLEMARVPANAVHAYLPLPWQEWVRSAATEAGLEPWLLAAVGRQESAFNPLARSPRGAAGVLQLMPGTARGIARPLGLDGEPDLYDPETNLRLGALELSRLIRKYGEVEVALAAYNAGETRARRWWRQWQDRFRFTESIPIPETYNYVRRVTFLSEAYRTVYADAWRSSP